LLRQPCVACVDGAVQAIRAKQALCPAAALVRVGIAFAPGSLLKLAFASVLQAASADFEARCADFYTLAATGNVKIDRTLYEHY